MIWPKDLGTIFTADSFYTFLVPIKQKTVRTLDTLEKLNKNL